MAGFHSGSVTQTNFKVNVDNFGSHRKENISCINVMK